MSYLRLALALSLSLPVFATPPTPDLPALPPVMVSASGYPTPPHSQVIEAKEIERTAAHSLHELLQAQAGIEYAKSSSIQSLFLRGQDSKYVAIYIDGVRALSDGYGNVLWQNMPLSQIERIEIIRGNASALYGDAAIGGAIHITTKASQRANLPQLKLGYGSRDTFEWSAGHGLQWQNYYFNIQASQRQSRGDSDMVAHTAEEAKSINPNNDPYDAKNLGLTIGYQLNPDSDIGLRFNASRTENQYDGGMNDSFALGSNTDSSNFINANDDSTFYYRFKLGEQWQSRLDLTSSHYSYQDFFNGSRKSIMSGGLREGKQSHQRWFNTYSWGHAALDFGAENLESHFDSGSQTHRYSQGYFGGYRHRLGAWDLQLNARHDVIHSELSMAEQSRHEATTGLMGLSYHFHPAFSIAATTSTAFRAPAVSELFDPWGGGNSQLLPEKHRSHELALLYQDNHYRSSLRYFQSKTDNAIEYKNSTYYNTSHTENDGIEINAATRVFDSLNVEASYTHQNPINSDTGKLLNRRAKNYGSLSFYGPFRHYDLALKILSSSARNDAWYDSAAGTSTPKTLDSYHVVHFQASRALNQQWRLQLRLENVLDQTYELAYGYLSPGRGAFISLNYTGPAPTQAGAQ